MTLTRNQVFGEYLRLTDILCTWSLEPQSVSYGLSDLSTLGVDTLQVTLYGIDGDI
jgi:hypothetical protein